jgi:dolichol-phosphate mannosyltransferase
MKKRKIVVFVPTYNEADNAPALCRQLFQLGLDCDVLFVDDSSPDGTAEVLKSLQPEFSRLIVQKRPGKLGIGSAHASAISWAYENDYDVFVSMDGDFSHSPTDVPRLIDAAEKADVAVGSRWIAMNSLPGWNVYRRLMTTLGHALTKYVLGIPHDASGAFRAYRLDKIEKKTFAEVQSQGYSFLFESMFILKQTGHSFAEIPIVLPARTYGNSKMGLGDVWHSGQFIFQLRLAHLFRRGKTGNK